jgi:hypothetical protein
MTDFNADLKRAFAALEDPADDGFAETVSARVAGRENRLAILGVLRIAAFAVSATAFALAVVSMAQAVGPGMVAQLGLELTTAYGAVSKGTAEVSTLQAALAGALTPLLLAAAAGIGGIAVARSAGD